MELLITIGIPILICLFTAAFIRNIDDSPDEYISSKANILRDINIIRNLVRERRYHEIISVLNRIEKFIIRL